VTIFNFLNQQLKRIREIYQWSLDKSDEFFC